MSVFDEARLQIVPSIPPPGPREATLSRLYAYQVSTGDDSEASRPGFACHLLAQGIPHLSRQ